MNKASSIKLLNAFPQLYRGFQKSLHASVISDFECNDGWFQILWDLSAALEAEALKEGRDQTNWPQAIQIKEKYGSLRFYMDHASPAMWDLVQAGEEKSGLVCEMCGEPGKTYNDSWINTSCNSCRPIP